MKSTWHYAKIASALLVLLGVTVGAAYIHFGPFNTAVAMAISIMKASLIVLFFMHVKEAGPFLRVFVAAGFLWLGLLIALTLSDYLTRS